MTCSGHDRSESAPVGATPRGLGARAVRRRAPRRHGVRRRRRGRALDRPGQAGRLLHGDQRRGRASTGWHPTSAAACARPSRSSRRGSSASTRWTSSGCPTASWSTASRCAARSPRRCALHRPEIVITGNFRDTLGRPQPQPGRPHRRPGKAVLDAVRDAGNRWVFPEQLAGGLEPWGGVKAGLGVRLARRRRTPSTSPTRSTRASRRCEAHRAYIDGLGWEDFDPAEFLEGMSRGRPASGSASPTRRRFEVFPMGWGE